jgi:hypothetical protein
MICPIEKLEANIYVIKENWLYYIVEIVDWEMFKLSKWYKHNKFLLTKYK